MALLLGTSVCETGNETGAGRALMSLEARMLRQSRRTSGARSRGSAPSAKPASTSWDSLAVVANLCSGAMCFSIALHPRPADACHSPPTLSQAPSCKIYKLSYSTNEGVLHGLSTTLIRQFDGRETAEMGCGMKACLEPCRPVDRVSLAPLLWAVARQPKVGPHVGGLQAGSRVFLADASAGCSVQPVAVVVQHKHRLHKVVVCQQRRLYGCRQHSAQAVHLQRVLILSLFMFYIHNV